MRRQFVTDSLIYLIPGLLHRGIGILLVPLYTRVLSPADYGVFDMLAVFAAIVNLTVAMEISQAIIRFSTDQPLNEKRKFASTGLWFATGMYLLFFATVIVLAPSISAALLGSAGHEGVFRLFMVYVLVSSLLYLAQNQLRFDMRSTEYMWLSVLHTVVTAGAAGVLAYGLRMGLPGIILGMIIGAAMGVGYGFWQLRHVFILLFDRVALMSMLKYSLPLVPASVAVFTSTYIDRIMITNMLGLHEVGIYGMAFRVASLVGILVAVVAGALHPIIFNNASSDQTPPFIAQVFRVFLGGIFVIWVALVVFSRQIFEVFTTPSYMAASELLVFLVPVLALANMYVFTPGMHLAKKTHTILVVCVFSGAVNALGNFLLIPFAGVHGAAMAAVIGYTVFFGAYLRYSQRLYPVPFEWRPIGICFALILFLILAAETFDADGYQRLGVGALIVSLAGAGVVATGLIRPREVRDAIVAVRGRWGAASRPAQIVH